MYVLVYITVVMKRAFIFTEYQLKCHCCSLSATSGIATLIKSVSVEENVPLGTFQSNYTN